jgi:hypothetical protein
MDVPAINLPSDNINVNKKSDGNTCTSIQSTKGSMYRNHIHTVPNTLNNQANNLKSELGKLDLVKLHKQTQTLICWHY